MSTVRAIVGARVSHVRGEEKTPQFSQRSKAEAYAESQNWTVVGAFDDLDISAIKLSPWQRSDPEVWLPAKREDTVRRCHPLTGGWVTCTGAFQLETVIWMELPGL